MKRHDQKNAISGWTFALAVATGALTGRAQADDASANAPSIPEAVAQPPSALRFADTYACVPPVMPMAALRKGTSGRTEVAFRVADDGSIADVMVTASSGDSREHLLLDRASLAHVGSCRYSGPLPRPAPGRYRTALDWRSE